MVRLFDTTEGTVNSLPSLDTYIYYVGKAQCKMIKPGMIAVLGLYEFDEMPTVYSYTLGATRLEPLGD